MKYPYLLPCCKLGKSGLKGGSHEIVRIQVFKGKVGRSLVFVVECSFCLIVKKEKGNSKKGSLNRSIRERK